MTISSTLRNRRDKCCRNIHQMPQGCVWKVVGLNISDPVVTSTWSGSVNDMVLNPSVYVLSDITRTGWNFYRRHSYTDLSTLFQKKPTEEGHCRERNMSQKSFISLEYQDLLKKKTSKLLQTLQMHDLTLNGW